jgi:hypothetical protein
LIESEKKKKVGLLVSFKSNISCINWMYNLLIMFIICKCCIEEA